MTRPDRRSDSDDFESLADEKRPGLIAEFWAFLKHSGKWWMLPVLVIVLVLMALVLVAGSPLGPFIYTLF